jgi:hypothetical protein
MALQIMTILWEYGRETIGESILLISINFAGTPGFGWFSPMCTVAMEWIKRDGIFTILIASEKNLTPLTQLVQQYIFMI